jgi:ribosome-associated protein
METITLTKEFIRLDALLKVAAVSSSGGEAKHLVQSGCVHLNGAPVTQRGKKIRSGDLVEVFPENARKGARALARVRVE